MRHIILNRFLYGSKYTLGEIWVDGQFFAVMERPWRNNETGVSCIPEGTYLVKYLARSASGKYRHVYHIQDTEPRLGILIHAGNVVSHSRGCPLIGSKFGILSGQRAVLQSQSGLARFRRLMGKEDFKLTVTSPKKVDIMGLQT